MRQYTHACVPALLCWAYVGNSCCMRLIAVLECNAFGRAHAVSLPASANQQGRVPGSKQRSVLARLTACLSWYNPCLSMQTDKAGFTAAKGGCNRLLTGLPQSAGWLMESLLTFLLVFVVFTATDQARAQSTAHLPILAPLGIGFAVFICHLAALALDGCSINRKLLHFLCLRS